MVSGALQGLLPDSQREVALRHHDQEQEDQGGGRAGPGEGARERAQAPAVEHRGKGAPGVLHPAGLGADVLHGGQALLEGSLTCLAGVD